MGQFVPPLCARREKGIQNGSVAGGPADERSVMLCESESSGVRRGVSRPCKSGNCVVYWSQSSKKRPSIDCRPSPISAAHRHTPPFHEVRCRSPQIRSEEHTSELQSLMRISYAVFCLKK